MQAKPAGLAPRRSRLATVAGVMAVAALGLYHQPYVPPTWLDEGFVLQGPLNLVRYGQYAMRSVEGFRVLDQPLMANGPGVVLPIALAFWLGGAGLLQARLVMVGFMVLTAGLFFAVARRLFGPPAAWISTVLLLAVPNEGFVVYGRHALGLVPALGYFLAGFWLWLAAQERANSGRALGAGLLFGLAIVTKSQYTLLVPGLLAAALVDRFYFGRKRARLFVWALAGLAAVLAGWYAAQLALVGWGNFGQHLAALRSSARVTVLVLRWARIPGNGWYVARSGWLWFAAPGVVYAAWQCRRQGQAGPAACPAALLLGLIPVWLAWFVLVSVGFHRYALEPFMLGLLFTGGLLGRAWQIARGARIGGVPAGRWAAGLRAAAALWVAGVALGGAAGLARTAAFVLAAPEPPAQQLAAYLAQKVGPDEVIETWEWEIAALADRTYHLPTNDLVDQMTAVLQLGDIVAVDYDPLAYRPAYLINGPFSKWTRLYAGVLAQGCCRLRATFGPYDLYAVERHAP